MSEQRGYATRQDGGDPLYDLLVLAAIVSLSFVIHLAALPGLPDEYVLPSDLLWGGLLVLAVLWGATRGRMPFAVPPRVGVPLAGLIVLTLIGCVTSALYRADARALFSLRSWAPPLLYAGRLVLALAVLLLAYHHFARRERAQQGARALLLAGAFVALVAVAQLLGLVPNFWPERRYWGFVATTSAHEGHIGGYMLVVAGLALQLRLARRHVLRRGMLDAVLVLAAVSIVLSGRRSAWVCLAFLFALIAVFGARHLGRGVRARWRAGAVLLLVVLVVVLLNVPVLRGQVEEIYDLRQGAVVTGGNLAFRWVAPLAYLRYMFEHDVSLLLGAGFASTLTNVTLLGGTHNQLVTWFFELGLPGLLFYLWFVVATARAGLAVAPRSAARTAFLCSLAALHLYSLAGGILTISSLGGNLGILFLTYVALAIRLLEQEPVTAPPSRPQHEEAGACAV